MAETRRMTGACACGAVTFTAARAPATYGACHCETCRRWSGGVFMAADCGPSVEARGELLVWQSSDWAERASCASCGSALWYRLKATGDHHVAVGAFDDQSGWTMESEIFVDEKPGHFSFANRTRTSTGTEFLARVAAASGAGGQGGAGGEG